MGLPLLFHPSAPVTVAEVNSPSLWDAGVEWGTAETESSNAYWQASSSPTPRTDSPKLCIGIAGRRVGTQGMSASWSLGRSDWLTSQLSPNTASLGFVGVLDAAPNDTVVISVESVATSEHSQPLWVGRVDTGIVTQNTDGSFWTSISATDLIGVLGQAKAPKSGGLPDHSNLQALTESLASAAGVRITVNTDDSLATIFGAYYNDDTGSINDYVLDLINRMERTSNALLFQQHDGTLRAVVRQPFTASTIEAIPVTGLNGFSSWVETTDPTNVFNDFDFASEGSWDDVFTPSTAQTASQKAYGERTFSVRDMLAPNPAAYSTIGVNDVLLTPRPLASATFPIYSLEQDVMFLDPLDVLDKDGVLWQVMSVSHNVDASGAWSMSIGADSTQSQLVDDSDPGTTDPPPTPGTTTVTVSYTSTKAGVAYRSSGGATYGNGADDYLSVGYYSGTRTRSLIQFPVSWSDFTTGGYTFIRVKKAIMTLRTSGQTRVAFGSSPKFYAQRCTDSWTEGSTTYPNDANGGNLTWPGPGATTSGQTLKSIGTSEDNDVTVDVTAIAQGWYDSGHNYGLRLKSANEDSHVNTTEMYSDDHAHGPTISITCEVTA